MYISEKDGIITHSVLGKFVTLDGGDSNIAFDEQRDEPNGDVIHFQQPNTRGALTLTRLYDPSRELQYELRHDQGDPLLGDIVVLHLDPGTGLAIPGKASTFFGCKVTKIAPPKKDAMSYAAAKVSYEFTWVKRV